MNEALERKRLFQVWCSMRSRCYRPADSGFKNYGARGIRVCERWLSFKNFLADVSPRPKGLMLERPDNNGDYGPSNFRWATRKEQNSNRRNCIYVMHGGGRVTLKEACRQLGLVYRAVHKRIVDRGWSVEEALATPVRGAQGGSHARA